MINTSFLTVVIFIIFVIVIFIYIASIGYNQEDDTKNIPEEKNIEILIPEIEPVKNVSKGLIDIDNVEVRNEINTHNFSIKNIDERTSYTIFSNFDNTCISVYSDSKKFYSQYLSGNYNVIFTSNANLIQLTTKLNKNKNIVIPLKLNSDYEVYFNNVSNCKIQKNVVNYNINYRLLELKTISDLSYNEFDLNLYANTNISNIKERIYFKNAEKENIFKFFDTGKYAIVYLTNKHNYNLNINSRNISSRKNNNQSPEIKIEYITNPSITIENLDYIHNKKSVHKEYVEFITVPNTLMNKFLYGSEPTSKNFSNKMNDKILIFSLL